ncbi:MAG: HD domain-containing protein [Treponema sp.]|nr:HD domain-containing protein [Treponema sp.]
MEAIATEDIDMDFNLSSMNEKFNMDALDNWTTTIGLIQSVISLIENTIPNVSARIFYHTREYHEYREIDKEGVISIPDDSILIGCLSMVPDTISLEKFFTDFQIEDPIIAEILKSAYRGQEIMPIVHGFDLLAFILICTKNEDSSPAEITPENISFLNTLSSRLKINLYAASIADKRQRELLQMTQYPFVLQRHNSLNRVYEEMLNDLATQINFDKGVAYAYDEDRNILSPFAIKNIDQNVPELCPGQGISGQVFEGGKSIFVPNRVLHPSYSILREEKFIDGSFISAPFGNEKTKFGVITLIRSQGNKKTFSVEHRYMLEIAAAFIASEISNRQLFSKLDASNFNMVESLTRALEAKDSYTEGHSERVTKYSLAIAKKMGYPEDKLHYIRYAAMLHDIGKIGIADAIINKPGKLNDDEYNAIKSHTEIGYRILSVNPFFKDVKDYVRYHHETLDGSGYHHKKEGEYPEEAMIISCADIFDALNTDRPYRKALSRKIIMQEMEKNVDVHYKREMLDALIEFLKEEKEEKRKKK